MSSIDSAVLVLVLALLPALLPATALGQESEERGPTLEVHGSPLLVPRDGPGIEVSARLAEPAELRLWVEDFDGHEVRELFSGSRDAGTLTRAWQGRMRTATRWPPDPIGSWPLPLAMMMPRVCPPRRRPGSPSPTVPSIRYTQASSP